MAKWAQKGMIRQMLVQKVHKIMKMLLYSKIARMNKRKIVVHNASLKGEVSTNTDLKKKNELLKLILKDKEQ